MESQIEEWRQRAEKFTAKDRKALDGPFAELDAHLTLRSFMVGNSQTDADVAVYQAIRASPIAHSFIKQGLFVNGECRPLLSTGNVADKRSFTLGEIHRRHKSFYIHQPPSSTGENRSSERGEEERRGWEL